MNHTNTFVLDDREDTFSLNEENGVQIDIFESDLSISDIASCQDNALLKFMLWLNTDEVKKSTDVRTLRKDKIFKMNLNEEKNKKTKRSHK